MYTRNHQPERLQQALDNLRRALEELESAIVEFEEELSGRSSVRPPERRGLDLLSIPEVCQELGMGKSWLYRKLKSGEIPSIKLGRVIKVKRSALEEYLENQALQQAHDTVGRVTDQAQGALGELAGQIGQVAHGARQSTGRAVDVGQAAEERAGTAEKEPAATQAAKRKAQALGVNLSQVEGSGAGGFITLKDVTSAANRR